MNDKIKKLQAEIELEKIKISNCNHQYGDPYYNPDVIHEGYGSVQDGSGSDPHWGYEGYRDVDRPRWTKKCNICGNEIHTYKQSPIISGYKPKF